MTEQAWPHDEERGEETPTEQGDAPEPRKVPGGIDPLTGEPGEPESSGDIRAA
jgi:hypothetical protein